MRAAPTRPARGISRCAAPSERAAPACREWRRHRRPPWPRRPTRHGLGWTYSAQNITLPHRPAGRGWLEGLSDVLGVLRIARETVLARARSPVSLSVRVSP